MEKYCKPNLPDSMVTLMIMSGEYEFLIKEIEALGINVIKTYQHSGLPKEVACHADMHCLHVCSDKLFVLKDDENLYKQLNMHSIDYTYSIKAPFPKYPNDIMLNCAVINNFLFGNLEFTDSGVKEYCHKNSINTVNINQGYAKCSTAIISKSAIITSDDTVYSSAAKNGFDVLKIKKGHIELPGYNYGFIGGSCGKISKDTLAFCGKIENHPSYKDIKAFAENYGIYLLSLSNNQLLDIGGMLPIKQKNSDY